MNSSVEKSKTGQTSEFQENLSILRENHFFSNLPLEALKVFAYLCTREKLKPGDYLFHQDEDDGQAVFLISGKAALEYKDDDGTMHLLDFDPGSLLGCLSLMGKMSRLYSLKAVEETQVIIMTREKFAKTVEQFPDLMPKILQAIVESVRAWEKRYFISHIRQCDSCRLVAGVSLL
jgi:CRP-like cAMP-binding protein